MCKSQTDCKSETRPSFREEKIRVTVASEEFCRSNNALSMTVAARCVQASSSDYTIENWFLCHANRYIPGKCPVFAIQMIQFINKYLTGTIGWSQSRNR